MTGLPEVVVEALDLAFGLGIDRLDAHLLLAHVLDRPRTWLLAHDDASLDSGSAQAYMSLCRQRAAGAPVAYLIGHKEFWGHRLQVTPAVLVPRPETELLVDWGLQLLSGPLEGRDAPMVVDLGTGSGAIAITLALACQTAQVFATDISQNAIAVAQVNANRLQARVRFFQGSWWRAVAGHRFDLALSNPPYIRGADHHLAALTAEPAAALTPGALGTEALDELVLGAGGHLIDGGWLVLEHGADQGAHVRDRLVSCGFGQVETRRDLAGLERCTGGCLLRPKPTI
ncbi:MAG: peptide chain release factor N(5)-glutamine methyltransferase [Aquabacterium sp.]